MATTTATVAPPSAIRIQNWGDDLRLPSFTHTAAPDTSPLLEEIAPLRKTTQPFQSRHLTALKRNQWFALRRPACRSRTGLLVIWPAKSCCVFVAPELPENKTSYAHRKSAPRIPSGGLALLRLRVDPQFYAPDAGLTVFATTLSASSRTLWFEDVLLWKGRAVGSIEPFTTRWNLVAQWLEHNCIVDTKLLSGLKLEMARWMALDAIKPEGVWELMADSPGSRRLLWVARGSDRTPTLGPEKPSPIVAADLDSDVIELIPAAPVISHPTTLPSSSGQLVAIATRDTSGPELWNLTSADNTSLGRALIRKMATSTTLRTVSGKVTRVIVVWCPTFSKWEIMGIADAGLAATHSSEFQNAMKTLPTE